MSKSIVRDEVRVCWSSMMNAPKNQITYWCARAEGVLEVSRALGLVSFDVVDAGKRWMKAAVMCRQFGRSEDVDQEFASRCQFDEVLERL